jgi:hypothetical protein
MVHGAPGSKNGRGRDRRRGEWYDARRSPPTEEAIARKLGDALVAPIVPFVPERDIDPPTEHMRYPSTISVTEGTYRALLAEICACPCAGSNGSS